MPGEIRTISCMSPLGPIRLGAYGDRLCLCGWPDELHPGRVERRLRTMLKAGFHDCGEITGTADTGIPEVLLETARQLNEYFNGHRRAFDLPLLPVGSNFQKRVWQQLLHIPYGTTVSYGELAVAIGSPDSVRAVANANGANAIPIIIPCHRVIGSDGSLTGYGGGIAVKRFLLELERDNSKATE